MKNADTPRKTFLDLLRLVFCLAVALLVTRKEIMALFNFGGAIASFISPKEHGDIQILGVVIAYATILCVIVVFVGVIMAILYFVLAALPVRVQFGIGALIVGIFLFFDTSFSGLKRLFESESPASPFGTYASPEKKLEIQK